MIVSYPNNMRNLETADNYLMLNLLSAKQEASTHRPNRLILLAGLVLAGLMGILMSHPNKPVFPWFYVLMWLGLACWVIRLCLSAWPSLLSPILFCMFFLVGYPLKIIYGQLSPRLFPLLSTGMYFPRKSPWLDFQIALAGAACIAGIGVGVRIALWFRAEHRSRQNKSTPTVSGTADKQALATLTGLFAIAIVLLYAFMWKYRIGQTGVRAVVLPFRLAGTAVHVKAVLVPMLEIYLLWQAIRIRARGLALVLVCIAGIETVASGFFSMSRATTLIRIIIFAIFFAKTYKQLPVKTVRTVLIGGLCLGIFHVFVIAPAITVFRVYCWSGGAAGSAIQAAFKDAFKSRDYLHKTDFVFHRVLGIEDLMGVAAYSQKNLPLMYDAFVTGKGLRFVNYRMFCLKQFAGRQIGGTTFIGRGMSIIGYLYLSGSFLLIFACSAAMCLGLCLVEIHLHRVSLPACAVLVTICVLAWWEGLLKPLFYSLIVFACSYILLTKMLEPWLCKRNGGSIRLRRSRVAPARTPF